MPTPAVSLKLKKFRRRFGIAAPRMVVRTHISWHWYLLLGAFLVLLLLAVWALFLQFANAGAVGQELDGLRERVRIQNQEIEVLRSTSGTGSSVASMERASQQKVLARLQFLEQENALLKEDVLLFERLFPSSGEESVLRIENFKVLREASRYLRYRFLVAYHGGKSAPEFRGRLQVVVSGVREGKPERLVFPEDGRSSGREYSIELKHFLRQEGVLEVPQGMVVDAVEVRLLQGDVVKVKAGVRL